MKYFVFLLIATTILAEKTLGEVADKPPNVVPSAPRPSIQSLFHTLTKLVEGVLDGDRFVLDLLGLHQPIALDAIQIDVLTELIESFNTINEDLKPEDG